MMWWLKCTIGGVIGGSHGERPAVLGEEIQAALVRVLLHTGWQHSQIQTAASPVLLLRPGRKIPAADQRLPHIPVHHRWQLLYAPILNAAEAISLCFEWEWDLESSNAIASAAERCKGRQQVIESELLRFLCWLMVYYFNFYVMRERERESAV